MFFSQLALSKSGKDTDQSKVAMSAGITIIKRKMISIFLM